MIIIFFPVNRTIAMTDSICPNLKKRGITLCPYFSEQIQQLTDQFEEEKYNMRTEYNGQITSLREENVMLRKRVDTQDTMIRDLQKDVTAIKKYNSDLATENYNYRCHAKFTVFFDKAIHDILVIMQREKLIPRDVREYLHWKDWLDDPETDTTLVQDRYIALWKEKFDIPTDEYKTLLKFKRNRNILFHPGCEKNEAEGLIECVEEQYKAPLRKICKYYEWECIN